MSNGLLNIFLVEDDEVDVMNVKRAFAQNNIRNPLFIAHDGVEALEKLRSGEIPNERRVVLLDLNMPRMNGIEFLREVRNDPALCSTTVVVLTTSKNEQDRLAAYNLNVAGYLVKPVTFANFCEVMVALNKYWSLVEFPSGCVMEKIGSTTESIPLASQNGTDRLRILIVDDDETDRLAVRRCLHQSGMSVAVDEAGSAAEALKLIGSSAYDCVLLDYYLPDVPGLSLFERLRAGTPDLPVVMFTGRGDEDIAAELMKAGAADYLPKASITPERLVAGLRHAIGLTRANAARKQAEHELRAQESQFRTLANAIPQFAWMADDSGARHWFNQRWLDYTGIRPEELKGWGWRQVHHPDHVDRVTQLIRHSCATGEPWEDTFPLRGKDGTYRWFLSRALPIRGTDGEIVGWLGTNTDVTDQKNAEAERERLLMLEHEARSRAEDAAKARDALLAIVAHDLRNPLHIIMSAAAKIPPSPPDEKGRNYVEFIQRSAREMNRLVGDLLDVSNMESGNFAVQRAPVDLRAVLEEARDSFGMSAQERNITLDYDVEADVRSVSADRDRLLQVIGNLLGNAFKFTPEGGRVSLRACGREGRAEIIIGDSGPGIAPENLPHIFERFWRTDRGARAGAGLGLSICKGIIEAHNGRIWAESTVGVGTTFHVSIPGAGVRGGAGRP